MLVLNIPVFVYMLFLHVNTCTNISKIFPEVQPFSTFSRAFSVFLEESHIWSSDFGSYAFLPWGLFLYIGKMYASDAKDKLLVTLGCAFSVHAN